MFFNPTPIDFLLVAPLTTGDFVDVPINPGKRLNVDCIHFLSLTRSI